NPSVVFFRGRVELDALKPAKAEPWLRKAVALAPFEREVVYHYALCLRRLKKNEEAKKWMERVKRIETDLVRFTALARKAMREPKNPQLRFQVGEILVRNQQDKEGLGWLANALKLDPGHRPTHEFLANYYLKKGKPDLAAPHQQALQSN